MQPEWKGDLPTIIKFFPFLGGKSFGFFYYFYFLLFIFLELPDVWRPLSGDLEYAPSQGALNMGVKWDTEKKHSKALLFIFKRFLKALLIWIFCFIVHTSMSGNGFCPWPCLPVFLSWQQHGNGKGPLRIRRVPSSWTRLNPVWCQAVRLCMGPRGHRSALHFVTAVTPVRLSLFWFLVQRIFDWKSQL